MHIRRGREILGDFVTPQIPHHRILKRRGQWEVKGEGRNKSSNVNVCVNSLDYGRGDWTQSEW